MEQVDPDRLVFLDESGLDTRLTRPYARAPGGQRAVGPVPGGNWRRLTILGAIARDGLVAVMTVAAATSTAIFVAFVEQVLIPALRARPGPLAVMDNLAPHKAAGVRAALGGAGPEDLTAMVAERPDATLAEYAEMLGRRGGRGFTPAGLYRALRRAGMRREKKLCTQASRSGSESLRRGQR